jgi:hypothetical protein
MGFLFSSILGCLGGHTSPDKPQTGAHVRQLADDDYNLFEGKEVAGIC